MAFWSWSKTAASNATADSTINWAEGQSPSSVNDSARAMMARMAEYRDDTSGLLTLGGTSTAFTLTTNQVFDSLAHMDKAELTIVPNVASGASPTLVVDGLAAKPIRSATGVSIPSGAMVAGTPYELTYFNAAGEFILKNSSGALPNGTVPVTALSFASGPALAGAAGGGNGAALALGAGFNLNGTTLSAATPPQGSFKNLAIKVASNTTVTLAADLITVTDGTNYQTLAFNQTINVGTTGANALDTGTIAIDTWYAIWAIAKSDGTVAGLASASATSPTMPPGYTFKARVGWVRTIHASATLYGTWQLGRRAQYVVGLAQTTALPSMISGSSGNPANPTWTAVLVSAFVPPTASEIKVVLFAQPSTTGSNQIGAIAAPNSSYGAANSASNPPALQAGYVNNANANAVQIAMNIIGAMMLETNSIYYASQAANSGMNAMGWEDNI